MAGKSPRKTKFRSVPEFVEGFQYDPDDLKEIREWLRRHCFSGNRILNDRLLDGPRGILYLGPRDLRRKRKEVASIRVGDWIVIQNGQLIAMARDYFREKYEEAR